MRAFIDTSTLFKKYVEEKGTAELLSLLDDVSDIIISPVTYIEIVNALSRYCATNKLGTKEFNKIKQEVDVDSGYFSRVPLSDELETIATHLCRKYELKAYDLVQLSAAIIAKPKFFLTSDKQLYNVAKKEIKNSEFIG